jgi:hypothetical protein
MLFFFAFRYSIYKTAITVLLGGSMGGDQRCVTPASIGIIVLWIVGKSKGKAGIDDCQLANADLRMRMLAPRRP